MKANTEQILGLAGKSYDNAYLVGGLSRSKAFNQILANVLNTEIDTTVPEGASVAGAIAAMIGTGKYSSLNEAQELITDISTYYPQEDQITEYESLYPEWKEIFNQSR